MMAFADCQKTHRHLCHPVMDIKSTPMFGAPPGAPLWHKEFLASVTDNKTDTDVLDKSDLMGSGPTADFVKMVRSGELVVPR